MKKFEKSYCKPDLAQQTAHNKNNRAKIVNLDMILITHFVVRNLRWKNTPKSVWM